MQWKSLSLSLSECVSNMLQHQRQGSVVPLGRQPSQPQSILSKSVLDGSVLKLNSSVEDGREVFLQCCVTSVGWSC